jgi:hypothetical protein
MLRTGTSNALCKHCKEPLTSIKDEEFLYSLNKYHPLRKDSVLWS